MKKAREGGGGGLLLRSCSRSLDYLSRFLLSLSLSFDDVVSPSNLGLSDLGLLSEEDPCLVSTAVAEDDECL